jgi:hypothetical protein
MFGRILRAAALMTVLTSTAAHARGPFGVVEVGGWKGGAYSNDESGTFSHCAAGATYNSGVYFVVSVNVSMAWSVGFAHNAWNLSQGETIPIALTFDGRSPFQVYGNALTKGMVAVPMPDNSELIKQFRKANRMTAFAKGQLYQFSLDTTSQLLPALVQCVVLQRNGLTSAMLIKPQVKPAGAPPKQTPVVSSLQPSTGDAASSELQLEAVQLATNFILKTKLQNPSVLSRAETPVEYASFGAAWKADEASGAVKIIPPKDGLKGIDIASAVAAGDSQACKGKFASGRVSELVDDEVVFRGFASCEDSAGSRTAQYFIVPRKRGGFVMFSVVSNMTTEPARNISRDEKIVDFKRAAVTVVSQ